MRTESLPCRHDLAGFTAIEALCVLAVSAVLLLAAVPAFIGLAQSMRLTSATNEFLAHLRIARSEAIKRNARVVLCKSSDGETCVASGGWEQGWIIFQDANDNGERELTEALIQRQAPLEGRLRLTGNQNVSRYVSFTPYGVAKLTSGAFQAGTLTVCGYSWQSTEARRIVLSSAGRPRVERTTLPQCT